jgi:mRNA interferase RelE/StbE
VGSYSILIKPSAAKELEAIRHKQVRQRIVRRIRGLAREPRPPGCEKLTGRELYRVRQGDHRVLHAIDDGLRTVTVVRVGHRRDVYRG